MKPVYFSKYIYFLIPSGDYSNAADATYNVIFLLTSCLATPAGWWSDVSFFLHVFHSLSYFNSIFLSIAVTHHYLSLSLLFSRPIILNPATPPQSFFLFFFKFYRYLWSPRFRNQIKTWYSTKCWDFNKNKKGKKDIKKNGSGRLVVSSHSPGKFRSKRKSKCACCAVLLHQRSEL